MAVTSSLFIKRKSKIKSFVPVSCEIHSDLITKSCVRLLTFSSSWRDTVCIIIKEDFFYIVFSVLKIDETTGISFVNVVMSQL